MHRKPFFTIIIPTYNREKLIVKAIVSVQKQTIKDWELIIVDDGSTDDTKNVINYYLEEDNRIKYIYQKNTERSAARNNGIKNSSGKYICFLDSDDIYKENHLSTFFKKIKEIGELEFMIFNQVIPKHLKVKSYNNYEKILKYMIHPQEVCIHKNILKIEKFDENLSIGEDYDLWIRIIDKFPVYNINKSTVIIYKHENRSINIEKKKCLRRQ
jgi:glycosyltransferase involved in cell wall biosynthesis